MVWCVHFSAATVGDRPEALRSPWQSQFRNPHADTEQSRHQGEHLFLLLLIALSRDAELTVVRLVPAQRITPFDHSSLSRSPEPPAISGQGR